MMKKTLVLLLVTILCAGLLIRPAPETRCDDDNYGVEAYRLLRIINDTYQKRINSTAIGSTATKTAMLQWIDETMASYGYSVHGNYTGNNFDDPTPVYSHTFVKPGNSPSRILIGAHYDCVDTNGCEDNGTGVAVAMELAKRFAGTETNLTLEFAFWDGEETLGSAGSRSYILQSPDFQRVMLVVNLDSIGAGDELYVYGGKYIGNSLKQAWGYNMARDIALWCGVDLHQMPIQVERYQSPTRSDASDQVWFYRNDVPYIYFEANAWVNDAGEVPFPDKPYNYNSRKNVFTPTNGKIIHTEYDDMDKLEELIPNVQMTHMRETSTILSWMIREMNLNSPATYEPLYEGKVYTANGWVTYKRGAVTDGIPPETQEPVTEPSTEAPSTEAPTTEAPTTEAPTTEAPTTEAPTTEAPETQAPATQDPASEASTAPSVGPDENQKPSGDVAPDGSTFAPSEESPSGSVPPGSDGDQPTEKPSGERPTKAPDKSGKKRGKLNTLFFWLIEGTILLMIALLAVFLILTSKKNLRKIRRWKRQKQQRRKQQ